MVIHHKVLQTILPTVIYLHLACVNEMMSVSPYNVGVNVINYNCHFHGHYVLKYIAMDNFINDVFLTIPVCK